MTGNRSKTERPAVTVLGLGAVGTALARAFAETGRVQLTLVGIGRSGERKLARELEAEYHSSPIGFPQHIDYLILAVEDASLAQVAAALALQRPSWKNMAVLHTSGAHGSVVLAPLERLGAGVAAWHPYQTFPKRGRTATLAGITFGISGNPRGVAAGRKLARVLGGIPLRVREEDRLLYHLSAVLACGFVAADLKAAVDLLRTIGFSESQARRAALAIAEETLRNVREFGPAAAQTGPAVRGDHKTIRRHLKALRERAPELVPAYRAQSEFVLKSGRNK